MAQRKIVAESGARRPPRSSDAGQLQTLDRGLRILELLARQESTPTDLGRALGIDRTTAHRVLRTLMARGFVERVENDGRYRANLRQFLTLSGLLASVGEQNWIALAQIQLNELSTTLGRSANLCMPTGTEMVYLFQILPGEGIAVNSPPGTRRPLHCSAVGKAYLGGLPVAECNEMATTLRYMKRTPTTILSARALLHDLAQGRQHGYYVDDGEWDSLINCVAAPILDRTDRPIASIGVTGVRASGPITPAVGASVNKAARLISMAIGHHESRVSSEAQG